MRDGGGEESLQGDDTIVKWHQGLSIVVKGKKETRTVNVYNHVIETSPGHCASLSAYAEIGTAQSRCNEKVQRQVTVPRLSFVVAIRVFPSMRPQPSVESPHAMSEPRRDQKTLLGLGNRKSNLSSLSPISLTSLYDGAVGYQAVHCWPETGEVQIVTTPREMAPGGKKSCLTDP